MLFIPDVCLNCSSPLYLHCCLSAVRLTVLAVCVAAALSWQCWAYSRLQDCASLHWLCCRCICTSSLTNSFRVCFWDAITRRDGCGDLTLGSAGAPGAGAAPQIRTRSAAVRANFHSANRLGAETVGRLEGPAGTCCCDSRISGARLGHMRPRRCAAAAPPPGFRLAILRCHRSSVVSIT